MIIALLLAMSINKPLLLREEIEVAGALSKMVA